MKLVDALHILRRPLPADAPRFRLALVCGFTPLHLSTFLAAQMRQARPDSRVEVSTGAFDDLLGSLTRATQSRVDALAVVIEWSDIDPRLGLRRLGGWSVSDLHDIVDHAEQFLGRLASELVTASRSKPVICCLPTLPLPPLFPHRSDESGPCELRLRRAASLLAASLSAHSGIRVCSAQRLDEISPMALRRDLRTEFSSGFPYSLAHASALSETLSHLIYPTTAKKGLITDLDDTLWSGILGEVGVENVSWNLDSHSQSHALYQRFLASLASAGVLIAVASKNDPHLVARAFERKDLLLPKEAVFPFEAHWGSKAGSVQRILERWNIGPDAVVMVDDSATELAEVADVFPQVYGVQFPRSDDGAFWPFLHHLRDLFGKHNLTAEDTFRAPSLRRLSEFRASAPSSTHSADDFLARANGTVTFSCGPRHASRAFELLNKTNQFNLNGARMTESAFTEKIHDSRTTLVTIGYEDKFGPLGTISALLVRPATRSLAIDAWVMSCRAFSRRIEHHCVQYLFDTFDIDEITAAYRMTERNGPVQEFIISLLGTEPTDPVSVTRDAFRARCPRLVHEVSEAES